MYFHFRAVYADADIYLLDNPLSAVDTRVAKKLMDECINGLLGDRIRILVTHNLGLLKDVDNIISMNLVRLFQYIFHYFYSLTNLV